MGLGWKKELGCERAGLGMAISLYEYFRSLASFFDTTSEDCTGGI